MEQEVQQVQHGKGAQDLVREDLEGLCHTGGWDHETDGHVHTVHGDDGRNLPHERRPPRSLRMLQHYSSHMPTFEVSYLRLQGCHKDWVNPSPTCIDEVVDEVASSIDPRVHDERHAPDSSCLGDT